MIASTDTSMSSPIMMLWFDFRVSTNMGLPPCLPIACELHRPSLSTSCLCARNVRIAAGIAAAQGVQTLHKLTISFVSAAWMPHRFPAPEAFNRRLY
jgi:hypothetical protein